MSNLERYIERKLWQLAADNDRLVVKNQELRERLEFRKNQIAERDAMLIFIRDIAKAGHLLANRWSIVVAISDLLRPAQVTADDGEAD